MHDTLEEAVRELREQLRRREQLERELETQRAQVQQTLTNPLKFMDVQLIVCLRRWRERWKLPG